MMIGQSPEVRRGSRTNLRWEPTVELAGGAVGDFTSRKGEHHGAMDAQRRMTMRGKPARCQP